MMRWLLMLLTAVFLTGCGAGSSPPNEVVPEKRDDLDKANIKSRLEGMAQSGQAGSGLAGMRESLEKMGDKSLLTDLDQLEKANNPNEVKSIAKRMAEKIKP